MIAGEYDKRKQLGVADDRAITSESDDREQLTVASKND